MLKPGDEVMEIQYSNTPKYKSLPTKMLIQIINAFVPAIKQAMTDEIIKSLDRYHGKKTGRLKNSVRAAVHITDAGGKVIVRVFGIAGGSKLGAYYGWFLEYGTGRYTDIPAIAKRGYLGIDFNPLRPAAGNGWDIVGRPDGPFPGKFISKGVKPTHWFRKGVANGLVKFDEINVEIAALANQTRALVMDLKKLAIA